MDRLFKLLGLLMVFSSSSACGAVAAFRLKTRVRKLQRLYHSLSDLRERIRLNEGEIDRLLKVSFGDAVVFGEKGCRVEEAFLEQEEIVLINAFLRDAGMSDAKAECDRIGLYMDQLAVCCESAGQKARELGRLYGALGVLIGLFLCIFLL